MLLIYEMVFRVDGAHPWTAAIEVASEAEAISHIRRNADEWEPRGDGSGTNFALVPEGSYTSLGGSWAWIPVRARDMNVIEYAPY